MKRHIQSTRIVIGVILVLMGVTLAPLALIATHFGYIYSARIGYSSAGMLIAGLVIGGLAAFSPNHEWRKPALTAE